MPQRRRQGPRAGGRSDDQHAFIRDCIVDKEKTHLIHGAIAAGTSQYGMQTFDQSIFGLFQQELVSYEEALRWATQRRRVQAEGPGHLDDRRA